MPLNSDSRSSIVTDPSNGRLPLPKPWGGKLAMNAFRDSIDEYSCHEGNYALPGILAGAREVEQDAVAKK